MKEHDVDMELSREILDNFNAGRYDRFGAIQSSGMPGIDGERVLDMTADRWTFPESTVLQAAKRHGLPQDILKEAERKNTSLTFTKETLTRIGIHLLPTLSAGVLNGGSSTSYLDRTKNRSFNPSLFELYTDVFDRTFERDLGKPKGIVPAYINPDGSPGFSFMELRLRNLLIETLRCRAVTGADAGPYPFFQMTSVHTDEALQHAYDTYAGSPALKDLMAYTGVDICRAETAVQPLITAYTHSRDGRPKRIFTSAWGREGRILPLPGGHGQNFRVLKDVYRRLFDTGKRFVSIGNVDNLGYTPEPAYLAVLCLSGKSAAFEFSFRTPVDVKGGVLLTDQRGRLNCGDIGVAVSRQAVEKAEASGKPVLFNCASGLFDLEYLVASLDSIIENLPVRFSDQEKDAGAYCQAEQVTWEILGMIDDPLILSVNKYDRFLASKLLLENLMTSGFRLDAAALTGTPERDEGILSLAGRLKEGLYRKLSGTYGLALRGERWIPLPPKEILESLARSI